jgi:hypothetical protein
LCDVHDFLISLYIYTWQRMATYKCLPVYDNAAKVWTKTIQTILKSWQKLKDKIREVLPEHSLHNKTLKYG